jgi:NAD(P)-dependent dehydrogenase (short-subunit alcohol dehydrogenase family)
MTQGRVALITGAGRGIGRAIANRLLAEGWQLSLGLRNPSQWQERPGIQTFTYDAMAGGEDAWVEAALDRFGRIDAIVANAGVMIPASVAEISDVDLDAMWAVNVRAPQRLARATFPALARSGQGRIIVIASLSGKRVASVQSSAYALTKHAAIALAHGLRQAGFDNGIRATAICPGFVSSDMGIGLQPSEADAMTTPDEIADIVNTVINLSNRASVAELPVNYRAEQSY